MGYPVVHLVQGDNVKAQADYTESARINPANLTASVVKGIVSGSDADLRKAMDSLEKSIPFENDRTPIWYIQRSSLWVSLNQLDKAMAAGPAHIKHFCG